MNDDAILRKVRALIELARNNPSAEEAAAAAEKAQALMVAYNLDIGRTDEATSRGYTRFAGGLYKWQRDLWTEIAALHFCMYWNEKGNIKGAKYEHKLLGSEHNVAMAKVLAEYLEEAIQRIVRDRIGEHPKVYFSKNANEFRKGMVATLVQRLRDKRWRMKQEEKERRAAQPQPSGQNALIISIEDLEQEETWANSDALRGVKPGTSKAEAMAAKARIAKWRAEWEAKTKAEAEADELLKQSDPAEWQRQQEAKAREAARLEAEDEKRRERWRKQDERNAKRRKGTGHRYKETPGAYYDGMDAGREISLNEQVQEANRPKLA